MKSDGWLTRDSRLPPNLVLCYYPVAAAIFEFRPASIVSAIGWAFSFPAWRITPAPSKLRVLIRIGHVRHAGGVH